MPSSAIIEPVVATLRSEPIIRDIQYVAVESKEDMRAMDDVKVGEGAVVSLAALTQSGVRLIDNIVL